MPSPTLRRAGIASAALAAAAALTLTVSSCADNKPAAFNSGTAGLAPSSSPTATLPTPAEIGDPSQAPAPLDDNGPTDAPTNAGGNTAAQLRGVQARQARGRAEAFMRAFARTDLPQQQWWAGISGFFTPDARAAYASTDVANVPVHHIRTGRAKLLPRSTRYRAQVAVSTDNGTYTITLIRAGDWLIDRAAPPRPASS